MTKPNRQTFIRDMRRQAESIGLTVEYHRGGLASGHWRVIEPLKPGRKTRDWLIAQRGGGVRRFRYDPDAGWGMNLREAAYVVAVQAGEQMDLDWDAIDAVFENHGLHPRSHGGRNWWELDMGCSECRRVGDHYGWHRGPALRVYINGTDPHRRESDGEATVEIHRNYPYDNDPGQIWPRVDPEVSEKRDRLRAERLDPFIAYNPDYPDLCHLLWSQGRFRARDVPQVLGQWLAQEIEWAREDVPPLPTPEPEPERGPAQIITPNVAAWARP